MEKAKDFSRKTVWPGSTQLAPVPVVLVGSGDGEKYPWNLVTIAWAGTVNSNPPMVSISVRPERHSFPAIRELGVFTVNIPPASLAKTVDWCGVVSGRDHDKIAEQQRSDDKQGRTGQRRQKQNRHHGIVADSVFFADVVKPESDRRHHDRKKPCGNGNRHSPPLS